MKNQKKNTEKLTSNSDLTLIFKLIVEMSDDPEISMDDVASTSSTQRLFDKAKSKSLSTMVLTDTSHECTYIKLVISSYL